MPTKPSGLKIQIPDIETGSSSLREELQSFKVKVADQLNTIAKSIADLKKDNTGESEAEIETLKKAILQLHQFVGCIPRR